MKPSDLYAEDEMWWLRFDPTDEPPDEHALGALAAMTRAAMKARKRAFDGDGYVWMDWNGKFQPVSDPDVIFPNGMDEDAPRP